MSNIFDPATFLDGSVGGPMSTERLLIPANTYPNCYIEDVKPQEGIIKEGDRTGEPWVMINFVWVIDDQEVRNKLDRSAVKITQRIMLDLTSDNRLDTGKGKNVQLGKLRKALGINDGEVQWRRFIGIPATIEVKHVINKKSQELTDEVGGVAGH